MQKPIAFISDWGAEIQASWITQLARQMPDETIQSINQLSHDDRAHIDLAIVANPDPQTLKTLPKLQWVQSLFAGVERIVRDIPDAPFRVVRLEDPEMALKMAEAVVAWVLYLHRDMPVYAAQQRQKIWKEQPQTRAGGRHIGIIGLGHLGQAAARALRALHFTVSGWSRSPKTIAGVTCHNGEAGLAALLRTVDIAVCLIPVTHETRGLLNHQRLRLMREGAQIINFARAPIIETDALMAALDDGHIAHAVLDVFDQEPLPPSSPLWTHPRVSVLPHISGPTNQETAAIIVANNIRHYRNTGEMPEGIDMQRGY